MPPIKAIIHEATFSLRAATDGKPTVVVVVGAGVAKQRKGKQKFRSRTVTSIVLALVTYNTISTFFSLLKYPVSLISLLPEGTAG